MLYLSFIKTSLRTKAVEKREAKKVEKGIKAKSKHKY